MADRIAIRKLRHQPECAIAIGLSSRLISCATSPAAKLAADKRRLQGVATALVKQTDADSCMRVYRHGNRARGTADARVHPIHLDHHDRIDRETAYDALLVPVNGYADSQCR